MYNYDKFKNELYLHQDIKYREFTKKLIPDTKYEIIGIRMNQLKNIAKKISKEDYISFFNQNKHSTFEEIMIHGLVIGDIKADFTEIIKLYKEYIKYIDNWSLCDSTVANLKIISKYPNKGLKFVIWCLKHKKTYYKRVGYVILLDYYIKEEYLEIIYNLCNEYLTDEYYVQMAVAWLISICYIKYPIQTEKYLSNNKLDTWTHNKSIQKIRESRQLSNEEKDRLLKYKK